MGGLLVTVSPWVGLAPLWASLSPLCEAETTPPVPLEAVGGLLGHDAGKSACAISPEEPNPSFKPCP